MNAWIVGRDDPVFAVGIAVARSGRIRDPPVDIAVGLVITGNSGRRAETCIIHVETLRYAAAGLGLVHEIVRRADGKHVDDARMGRVKADVEGPIRYFPDL